MAAVLSRNSFVGVKARLPGPLSTLRLLLSALLGVKKRQILAVAFFL